MTKGKPDEKKMTPVVRQYHDIKKKYQDTIIYCGKQNRPKDYNDKNN